jgi:two-component system alkaline phosphatase synthesis response regulator PhoP
MGGSRILIIESETSTAAMLAAVLSQEGFSADRVTTGFEGLQTFDRDVHSAVIMSFDLPGFGGPALLRALRNLTDSPVLVLFEKADERTRVAALDDGADDIVMKPFFPRELVARMRAALRRSSRSTVPAYSSALNSADQPTDRSPIKAIEVSSSQAPRQVEMGGGQLRMVMNEQQLRVDINGVRFNFSGREYGIFSILASHSGELVSKERLLKELQATNLPATTRVLDVYMCRIRRKISESPNCGLYLKNVRGRGWRLEAVTESE